MGSFRRRGNGVRETEQGRRLLRELSLRPGSMLGVPRGVSDPSQSQGSPVNSDETTEAWTGPRPQASGGSSDSHPGLPDFCASAPNSGLPVPTPTRPILAPSPQPRRASALLAGHGRTWASDLPQLGRRTSGAAPLLVPGDSGKSLNQED